MGVDISIQKLIAVLQKQKHTPSSQLLLFHADGHILLSSDPDQLQSRYVKSQHTQNLNLTVHDLKNLALQEMYTIFNQNHQENNTLTLTIGDEKWLGTVQKLSQISNRRDVFIAMVSPFSEKMAEA